MLLIGFAIVAGISFLIGMRFGIAMGYRGERRRRLRAEERAALPQKRGLA